MHSLLVLENLIVLMVGKEFSGLVFLEIQEQLKRSMTCAHRHPDWKKNSKG